MMNLPDHLAHVEETKFRVTVFDTQIGEKLSEKFAIIFADSRRGYFIEWAGRNEDGSTILKLHQREGKLRISKESR